jgi:membrane-bound lytic murein transglycosylase D
VFHKLSNLLNYNITFITLIGIITTLCIIPKEIQAVTEIKCSTNFPCPDELKPKIEFWVRVFQEFRKNQAVFHDAETPEMIYSVIESDTFCGQGRRNSPIELERTRIKNVLKSIQEKQSNNNSSYTSEEQTIVNQIKSSKTFELDKATDRIRCQNGVRDQFEKALSRYKYYRNDVVQILKDANLPEEIQYLPFVESSYNPLAYSKVGAAGLWQIMPKTARVLGLKINASIDERLDPILATKAATRYFDQAYSTMINTASSKGYDSRPSTLAPFVMTSYNYGISGMKNALAAHGVDFMHMMDNYKGKSFRVAVKNFYASFLAAKHIVMNENHYFQRVEPYQFPQFNTLNVPRNMSATKFSENFSISIEILRELNPVLTKRVWSGVQPIPQNFTLKIPHGTSADSVGKEIASLSSEQIEVKIRNYKVEKGDVLCGIARTFDVSCNELMTANGLTGRGVIRVGQVLNIPGKESKVVLEKPVRVATKTLSPSQQSILVMDEKPKANSEKSSPDAPDPRILNSQSTVIETPPQVAAINPPSTQVVAPQPVPENQPVVTGGGEIVPSTTDWLLVTKTDEKTPRYFIRAESEETLGHFSDWIEGTTTQSLRDLNGISFNKPLTVGQKIYLPLQTEEQKNQFEKKRIEYHQTLEEGFEDRYNVIAFTTYQVKRGDNEWTVSDKLQIPMWLIRKYNPMVVQKSIRAGDTLTVPLLKEKSTDILVQELPTSND